MVEPPLTNCRPQEQRSNTLLILLWLHKGGQRSNLSRPQNLLDFLLITSNFPPPTGHRRLNRRLPDGFVSVFVTSSSQFWLSSLQCPNTVFTGDALAAVSNLRTSLYSLERCSPASTGQTYISGKTDTALRHKRKPGEGTERKKMKKRKVTRETKSMASLFPAPEERLTAGLVMHSRIRAVLGTMHSAAAAKKAGQSGAKFRGWKVKAVKSKGGLNNGMKILEMFRYLAGKETHVYN